MRHLNISLPEPLKDFVDGQVAARGYPSSGEYIRDLIRLDQTHQAEARLSALIAEGLESGPAIVIDDVYWADKRANLIRKHAGE